MPVLCVNHYMDVQRVIAVAGVVVKMSNLVVVLHLLQSRLTNKN